MAKNASMTIFIGGDNSDFLKKWESTKRALRKGLGAEALAASEGIVAGLAAGAAALAAFGMASIKLAGDLDASRKALTTLLGDAQAAEKMLADLAAFAADTPFEMKGLLAATKRLLAFGFASQDIIPMLAAIGDAAAMLGIGEEGVNRLTLAIGQMQAKGKVSAEEMLQLAEAGVPAWQFLADAIGTDIPTAMKMAEQGAIDSTTGINAVLMGMQTKFQGGMEAMSKTIPGLMSTIKDNVSAAMVEIGDSIAKNLNLVERMQGIADWLTDFAAAVKAVGIKDALQAMIPPEAIATVFALSGALLGAAVPAMVAFGISVWTAMAPLLPFIAAGAAMGLLAYEIWNNWEPLSELFRALWDTITDIFSDTWNTIVGIVTGSMETATEAVGEGWVAVGEATASAWQDVVDFIDNAWASIKDIVAQGVNWVIDALRPLGELFAKLIPESVSAWFGRVSSKISEGVGKIGTALGEFNLGFSRKNISQFLTGGAKPNRTFTGLTNAGQSAAAQTSGTDAEDKEWEKLKKKTEQVSKEIKREWLELTATRIDALDDWYAEELEILNESKDANENYERDLLRLNEIYAAKRKKILLDEQRENNRIADQAVNLARSLSEKIGSIGLYGVDKQKFDIESDAARQIDDMKKKYRDLALEYAASAAAQQEEFRKAWQENGIQFTITAEGMVDFSRQMAAEQAVIEAEKNQKIKDLHYERVKWQEELDRAREVGDLERFRELLNKEEAMQERELSGRRQLIDSFYKIWQEAHRTAMSYMAELTDGLYDKFADFFSDVLSGTKSLGDAFQNLAKSVLKMINDMIAKWLAARVMMGLFGKNFFTQIGGGSIPAFASGGYYSGGYALVGEKGPELINFNRGGYVYNAQDTKRLLQSGDTYHQISVPVTVAGETSPRLAGRLRTEITELVQRIIYEEARA